MPLRHWRSVRAAKMKWKVGLNGFDTTIVLPYRSQSIGYTYLFAHLNLPSTTVANVQLPIVGFSGIYKGHISQAKLAAGPHTWLMHMVFPYPLILTAGCHRQ